MLACACVHTRMYGGASRVHATHKGGRACLGVYPCSNRGHCPYAPPPPLRRHTADRRAAVSAPGPAGCYHSWPRPVTGPPPCRAHPAWPGFPARAPGRVRGPSPERDREEGRGERSPGVYCTARERREALEASRSGPPSRPDLCIRVRRRPPPARVLTTPARALCAAGRLWAAHIV